MTLIIGWCRLALRWLARWAPAGILALTVTGLAAGGVMHLAGATALGDAVWLGVGGLGLVFAGWAMAESLRRRRAGVDLIALLALAGAMAVGELLAAAVVTVMLASGRALEAWAAGRARRDLSGLLERAPRTARRYRDGGPETVPLDAVLPGDALMVAVGDVVPVDGTVTGGSAVLDESALTGEPVPVEHPVGDRIRSGAVNLAEPFDLRAEALAADSTYAGIVRLVSQAEAQQPPAVRLADRYALLFLLVTLIAAAATWVLAGADRAVAVLVVATPCPLILAVPVALVSGMSVAARRGVVVKGGGVLERLARCSTLLLDKTGTLTSGSPAVAAVWPAEGCTAQVVLHSAASLDQASGHVLAGAVVRAAKDRGIELTMPQQVEEVAGQGIRGVVRGRHVAVGKASWCGIDVQSVAGNWAKTARRRARLDGALTIYVAIDGRPAGVLVLEDPIRPDALRTIRALRASGIRRIVMVTGDRLEVAETVGAFIGMDAVLAERTPAEKLDAVRAERLRGPVMMAGDGVNDAPALTLADVGIAMGARGTSASSETADAVLVVDRLDRLGEVVRVACRTRRIALQSVLAGMTMSLVAMGAAAAGLLPAVWGAVLQEVIDVVVILNALRALRFESAQRRLLPADLELARRFHDEHEVIREVIDELGATADCLGLVAPDCALERVRHLQHRLVTEVVPHERAEEGELYPALDRVLGSAAVTETMSRGHAEITREIRRIGQVLDDMGEELPDDADIADLRAMLYGLQAILRLHTAQEDESYLSDLSTDRLPADLRPYGAGRPGASVGS